MIEINLLPEEMRKKKRSYLKLDIEMGKFKLYIGAGCVGCLILLLILLSTSAYIRKRQVLNLMQRETLIASKKSEVEEVNKKLSTLKARIAIFDQITKRRFLYARKLNELSDLVLPGIWFTRINTDLQDRLIIEGSAISKNEEPMASVGKFMKNIREDNAFFKDFRNIKLETVQRKDMQERDVVDFRIALYF